jgi:hypothetical protein
MRVSKKIFSVTIILLCTTIVGTSPIKSNPTLTTLKWKSSEIVNDSEGQKAFDRIKPSNLLDIWPERRIKHKYVEDLNFEIVQVDDNTFQVLGSPIEWRIEQ